MRARRALGVVALLVATTLLIPWPAGAHALLRDSTPADGEIVDTAPREVVLEFTEPPELGLSSVSIVDGHGTEVGDGELRRAGGPAVVAVDLPDLEDGVYTVSWRVLSRVDGHVTAGAFAFGVGHDIHGEVSAGEDTAGGIVYQRPSPLSVAGRWGLYWGLALLMGGALSGMFVFRRPIPGARLLVMVGWALGAAGLVALLITEAGRVGASAMALLGSDRGRILIARAIPLLAAGVVAIPATSRPGRVWPAVLGAITAVGMLAHAWAGHAAAAESFTWVRVGVQWIHILAVGIWIGGLAWLLAGLLADRREEDRGGAVRRFSFIATFALVGVAATGALRAWDDVGSISALFDTGFGLTAVGKTVLFAGLLALGAYNRYRLVPRIEGEGKPTQRLRRTVSTELLLAAGVFGLTGVMAGLAPPTQVAEAAQEHAEHGGMEPVVAEGSDFATTVRVRLEALPGTAGPNGFDVRLSDYDTEEPLEATQVVLRFSIPERPDIPSSELSLTQEGPGHWRADGTNLSVDGTWRIGVRIQAGAGSVEVPLELTTRSEEPRIDVVEGGPGEPNLYTIHLPGSRSVQSHVEPGEGGHNEVHYTFFTEEGSELPLADARGEAVPEDGEPRTLEVRRLSPGHFVASAELEPGAWTFRMEVTTEDGEDLVAEFEEQIE